MFGLGRPTVAPQTPVAEIPERDLSRADQIRARLGWSDSPRDHLLDLLAELRSRPAHPGPPAELAEIARIRHLAAAGVLR